MLLFHVRPSMENKDAFPADLPYVHVKETVKDDSEVNTSLNTRNHYGIPLICTRLGWRVGNKTLSFFPPPGLVQCVKILTLRGS